LSDVPGSRNCSCQKHGPCQ